MAFSLCSIALFAALIYCPLCLLGCGGGGDPTPAPTPSTSGWYKGIDSIWVFGPEDMTKANKAKLHDHYTRMLQGELNKSRLAVLLKKGNYGSLDIGVPFYTSIAGVGSSAEDVVMNSFYSEARLKADMGGSTKTFWRSVEGVTATSPLVTWATAQGCPIRRSIIKGNLKLSATFKGEYSDGPSSGGFIGDSRIEGNMSFSTQQQYFLRNSETAGNTSFEGVLNAVYVGSTRGTGTPTHLNMVSDVPKSIKVAEKPYLLEEAGQWYIAIPPFHENSQGRHTSDSPTRVSLNDAFVAREGDDADAINKGIVGKKALILTPAIYGLDEPIKIDKGMDNFVVLGIGFATLVATKGRSALVVAANDVRVASVLMEGASPKALVTDTDPVFLWSGQNGIGSDIFVRVGAFSYETPFHRKCELTSASVLAQVEGNGVVLDNAWLWHADHDDCSDNWPDSTSTRCHSDTGLVVKGDDVIVYGLSSEHVHKDQVQWKGERGKLFFYQSEVPYVNPYTDEGFNWGDKYVGYRVDRIVKDHAAVGMGVYLINIKGKSNAQGVTAFDAPAAAKMTNLFIWHVTEKNFLPYFKNIGCSESGCNACGDDKCGVKSDEFAHGYVYDWQKLVASQSDDAQTILL